MKPLVKQSIGAVCGLILPLAIVNGIRQMGSGIKGNLNKSAQEAKLIRALEKDICDPRAVSKYRTPYQVTLKDLNDLKNPYSAPKIWSVGGVNIGVFSKGKKTNETVVFNARVIKKGENTNSSINKIYTDPTKQGNDRAIFCNKDGTFKSSIQASHFKFQTTEKAQETQE